MISSQNTWILYLTNTINRNKNQDYRHKGHKRNKQQQKMNGDKFTWKGVPDREVTITEDKGSEILRFMKGENKGNTWN